MDKGKAKNILARVVGGATHLSSGDIREACRYALDVLREQPSLPSNVDEAAENYIAPIENDEGLDYINFNGRDIKDAFIAGAEWHRNKMMEEAVEGELENATFGIVYLRKNFTNEGYTTGDKVRIILLKDNEDERGNQRRVLPDYQRRTFKCHPRTGKD